MEDDPDVDDDAAGPGAATIEQFQRAALDAVHAARALLDAAESVIQEPAAIEAVVKTVTSVARTASEAVAGFAVANDPRRASDDPPTGDPGDDEPEGFEHISVG